MDTRINKPTSSEPVRDLIFSFTAQNGFESACRLLISGTVVVVSDIDSGQSVTNAAEHIANLVAEQFQINPASLLWIEHYPVGARLPSGKDEFDLVQFNWNGQQFSDPRWTQITREAAEALFGHPIPIKQLVSDESSPAADDDIC